MRDDVTRFLARRVGVDGGSLPLAMLLILVGTSLTALLVPIVGNQLLITRTDTQRVQALAAAQAGLDIAMAQVRAAADADDSGLLERLPTTCDAAHPLTGDLGPGAGAPAMRYRVEITYMNANKVAMGCPAVDTPTTATLKSTGAGSPTGGTTEGAAGSRTITATYNFGIYNANIMGGAIRISENGSTALCLDSGGGASPAAGVKVQLLTCVPGTSSQRFAYTKDQNIRLVGSETVAAPTGMCLDAAPPHTTGTFLVFAQCGDKLPRQRWILDAVTDFHGTNDGVNIENSVCLDYSLPYVITGPCGGVRSHVLTLDIEVGAGMAGADVGQLVNFKQFSRCVDVTYGDPAQPFDIGWYCHQAPDGNYAWNQRWTVPVAVNSAVYAVGRIRTVRTSDNAGFCLRSPGSTASNQYVATVPCAATGPLAAGLTWTVYTDTGDYTTSYRIVDEYGFCFTFTDLDAPNPDRLGVVAKTKVAACSNSTLQKWNADPNISRPSPLTDISEK